MTSLHEPNTLNWHE